MRRASIILSLLVLLSLSAVAAADYSVLAVSAEEKALAELGVEFTAPGNAAAVYYPYLVMTKPVMKSRAIQDLSFGSLIRPENEKEKALRDKLLESARPDLEEILSASRMSGYRLWGEIYKPDPQQNLYVADTVLWYMGLAKLSALLIPESEAAAAAGDLKAAEDKLLALINIGRQMQRNPSIVAWASGNLLKRRGASTLVRFFNDHGRPDQAARWEAQFKREEAARDAFREAIHQMHKWTREQAEAFVRDPEMPVGMKVELLMVQTYCIRSRMEVYKCWALGPPDWVVDLRAEVKDPEAQAALKLLENELTLSEAKMIPLLEE